MSVEKLIAEIRELDRDTVPVKATFESGSPPEEFLYLKRNHILKLSRIIEVQRGTLKNITTYRHSIHDSLTSLAWAALAESDRIAKEGKE